MSYQRADAVHQFWFADTERDPAAASERNGFWYASAPQTDQEIATRFGDLIEPARSGRLDKWLDEPRSALSLIIVLDQFPRNVWRATRRAFSCDGQALDYSRRALDAGHPADLTPVECVFMLMPFQHCEAREVQEESVAHFAALLARSPPPWRSFCQNTLNFARKHQELVETFGRFPHRNHVMERQSTNEEEAFLRGGGETFGQAGDK